MTSILIVEDEHINFRVFSKILTKRGELDVKGTDNVEKIFKIVKDREVDLIPIDAFLFHGV